MLRLSAAIRYTRPLFGPVRRLVSAAPFVLSKHSEKFRRRDLADWARANVRVHEIFEDHAPRSATVTGTREALTAGSSPLITPIPSARCMRLLMGGGASWLPCGLLGSIVRRSLR